MKIASTILLLAILISSCANSTPIESSNTETSSTQQVFLQSTSASTSTPSQTPLATNTITPIPITQSANSSIMSCADTAGKNGQFVQCRIEKAYCTFHPDVNGDPTYCNDAPYPNHQFTLLFWNQDLTEYDGKCLIISGVVGSFEGKPQIKTKNRARVTYCP